MSVGNGIRVALVTCHDKRNYGAMLQAWATQRFLEDQGYDVRTIDRGGLSSTIGRGRRDYYLRHVLDVPLYAEKAPFAARRMLEVISPSFRTRMALRQEAFDDFARSHFRLTRRVFSFEEARELSGEYDAVVVGSDQLWLPVNVAGGYYTLAWVDPSVRRVSYGTSLGLSRPDAWAVRRLCGVLDGFHAVSVREGTGARAIERACGTRPQVVCDPTMLLGEGVWRDVASSGLAVIPDEPYLLAYFLGRNAWQRHVVARHARERGLRVVAIAHGDSYVRADERCADLCPWDVGPAEWLSLVAHASLVCSDSFHAAVFASLFRVPFVTFRRHAAGATQSTNARLDDLLSQLGLEGRVCEDPADMAGIAGARIDFEVVQARVARQRERSARWLSSALSFEGVSAPRHVEIRHKEECCGCGACATACPNGCITMGYDEEGCEYPQVDRVSCDGCGACRRACPALNVRAERRVAQRAFVVQHRDDAVLLESTSGGAMTALGQVVLARGGVVFGAGFLQEDQLARAGDAPGRLQVGHFGVSDEADLRRFRNSKYVQSAIGPAFDEVRHALGQGREVLFIGTPCQCEGLLGLVGRRPANLFVADVVCRAVVCRAVLASYVRWLDGRVGRVVGLRFRDKTRYGYDYSSIQATGQGQGGSRVAYSAGVESDPYLRAFFSDLSDRPSCYRCPFKRRYRPSDLTCWDCFDVGTLAGEMDDNRGATRVLVHSEAGQRLLDDASVHLRMRELAVEEAIAGMREMVRPVDANPRRRAFMSAVASLPPDEVVERWFPDSLVVRTERAMRHLLHRMGVYGEVRHLARTIMGRRS